MTLTTATAEALVSAASDPKPQQLVRVRLLRGVWVDGQSHAAGAALDVPAAFAAFLVGANKAERDAQPDVPPAAPAAAPAPRRARNNRTQGAA